MSNKVAQKRPLHVPVWLAFCLAMTGGASAAIQAVVNGELGDALGLALSAGVVSNSVGTFVFLIAMCCVPSMRAGFVRTFRQGLPWWMFCGGLFGAAFAFMGAYATPLVGIAIFTIGHVCGNTLGGLGTDSVGLGPSGRIRLTGFRFVGAALAVAAVSVTQLGHATDTQQWWLAPLIVAVGAGVAVQGALNGRLNDSVHSPMSTGFINFLVGTIVLYAVMSGVLLGGQVSLGTFPSQPWLYVGGICGAIVVLTTLLAVKSLGVFGLGLGVLTGQLSGALVLDVVATGTWPSLQMALGVALTVAAVLVASMSGRRGKSMPVEAEPIVGVHNGPDDPPRG